VALLVDNETEESERRGRWLQVAIRPSRSRAVVRPLSAGDVASQHPADLRRIGGPVKFSLRLRQIPGNPVALQVSSARTIAMRKPKAPEANRARILAAAIAEFASRGFKGASMDAIAARTQTTRALINYYFGSKERLYLAVLERVYAEIREAENELELEHLAPVDAIRRIVEFTYDYYVEHEYFVRLVGAENQAKGRHMKRFPSLRTVNRPIVDRLGAVIARGQTEGVFRPNLDPIDVHMAIAALGMFNVTNQYTFGTLFQRDMGAQGDVPARRRTVADMILSWLAPASTR
jgi:AcrR family transcriptional regulator